MKLIIKNWQIHPILLLVLGCLFLHPSLHGQDQRIADSLAILYYSEGLDDAKKLVVLEQLVQHENRDMSLLRTYSEELIALADNINDHEKLQSGYMALGNFYRITGSYEKAINYYFKARELAFEQKDIIGQANANTTIADTYSEQGNHDKAYEYYDSALSLNRESGDPWDLASTLYNYGDALIKGEEYESALSHLKECDSLFRYVVDAPSGALYTQGNIGLAYAKTGKFNQGVDMLQQSISGLKEMEDHYALTEFYRGLSEVYHGEGDLNQALNYAELSLETASTYSLRPQTSQTHLLLSKLYDELGLHEDSYEHLDAHIVLHDSIQNKEIIRQQEALRADYEIAQRQAQLDLVNEQKDNQRNVLWATGIVALLLSVLAFAMYRKNKFVHRTNKIIEAEQNRSESLLLNILPKQTAQELKEKGKVKAKKFESVSVLFTDFVDFTKYAEQLDPEILVQGMDHYYGKFDEIIEKYGLEKIKTVGDSYMCAGGIPNPDPDHGVKIVRAAMDIVAFVESEKKAREDGKIRFDIRVGINSGPLVAGVVGTKKFAYDIWGDTVNVAARMESKSEPGQINISELTYELVKNQFDCEYRGEIEAKNKGKLKMFFVKGPKTATEVNSEGQASVMTG